MNTHRRLLAWQACRELIRQVYVATRSFPREEVFGLTSQLRRAAVSAASDLGYLTGSSLEGLGPHYERASKLTFGLHRSLRPQPKATSA